MSAELPDSFCWRSVQEFNWLDQDVTASELAPADALPDLQTDNNAISFYLIPKREAATLGDQIAAAMACGLKGGVKHYEYVLFEAIALSKVAAKFELTPGDTPDAAVNKLHVNVHDLSADQIAGIADWIWKGRMFERRLDDQMASLIAAGITSGRIDRSRVTEKVINRLRSDRLIPRA